MTKTPRVQLIIPTTINFLTSVNETLLTEHRAGEPLGIVVPSLRRRALLLINEVGVLPIQTFVPSDDAFKR